MPLPQSPRATAPRVDAGRQFRTAFEHAPIGMALIGLDGRYLEVNAELARITGYAPEAFEHLSMLDLVDPTIAEQLTRDFADQLARPDGPPRRQDRELLRADGDPVWVTVSSTIVRDDDGTPQHCLAQYVDITETKRLEAQLRALADHDELTGLVNRRGFDAVLERHVARQVRYGPEGSLLLIDIDGFRSVNDSFGHATGDEVLTAIAHAIRDGLRTTDLVARVGDDDFAVLLPKEDEAQAEYIASKVIDAVRASATIGEAERHHQLTLSVGVFCFDAAPVRTGEAALMHAVSALHDAKEAGPNGVAVFRQDGHGASAATGRRAWRSRLRTALDDGRFVLDAQPIVSLTTGEVVQHELFVRMLDEDGTLISPGAFLPAADRFGFTAELDQWVVAAAIALLAETADRPDPPRLAINLSGRSVGDELVLETVRTLLEETGVDPVRLTIELTERAAIADVDRAQEFARALTDLGCRFALDDFGSGFGSLFYLKHLPFDELKIDGEFVASCSRNRADLLIIEAAVNLARGLGKRTVGEFVGDPLTQRRLRTLGVDYAQGFLLGRPEPVRTVLGLDRPSHAPRAA